MPVRSIRVYLITLLALGVASILIAASARADRNQDCVQHANLDLQVRSCSEIIRNDSQAAWAYINRSWAYMDKAQHDLAIADATKALEINPSLTLAYVNRSGALLNKGDNDRAIADASKAIELDPKMALGFVNRATGYFNKGENDRAIADANKAIELNPKISSPYVTRSAAKLNKDDFDGVIADATEAIRLDPRSAYAYNNRGLAHKAKGDHDRALADFDEAIRLLPNFALAYVNRGYANAAQGDHDRAIADYDRALQLDQRSSLAYNNRGWAYQTKGDFNRAIADFSRAIEIAPNMGLAYANRGTAYSAKGDNDLAIADFKKILELPAVTPTERQRQEIARERITRLAHPAPPPKAAAPARGPRRVALVIGNSNYTSAGLLTNPRNDAKAVAAALRRLGFTEVLEHYDMPRDKMGRALRDFGDQAEGAEWAVVFFAGHGIEVNGTSYLIPTDAELKRETHVSDEAISLTQVQAKVDAAAKLGLVILDSCRNNPFVTRMVRSTTTRSITRGLSPVEPEGNVLVAYAAKHGTTADDGTGEHSPFTEALLAHIEEPGLEINFLFRKVRDRVRERTAKRQEPFLYGTLGSDPLYFKIAQAK